MEFKTFTDLQNVMSVRTFNVLFLNGVDTLEKFKGISIVEFSKCKRVSYNTCVEVSKILKESFGVDVFEKTGFIGMMVIYNRFGYKLCGNY